jgi:hypothetical protein
LCVFSPLYVSSSYIYACHSVPIGYTGFSLPWGSSCSRRQQDRCSAAPNLSLTLSHSLTHSLAHSVSLSFFFVLFPVFCKTVKQKSKYSNDRSNYIHRHIILFYIFKKIGAAFCAWKCERTSKFTLEYTGPLSI